MRRLTFCASPSSPGFYYAKQVVVHLAPGCDVVCSMQPPPPPPRSPWRGSGAKLPAAAGEGEGWAAGEEGGAGGPQAFCYEVDAGARAVRAAPHSAASPLTDPIGPIRNECDNHTHAASM